MPESADLASVPSQGTAWLLVQRARLRRIPKLAACFSPRDVEPLLEDLKAFIDSRGCEDLRRDYEALRGEPTSENFLLFLSNHRGLEGFLVMLASREPTPVRKLVTTFLSNPFALDERMARQEKVRLDILKNWHEIQAELAQDPSLLALLKKRWGNLGVVINLGPADSRGAPLYLSRAIDEVIIRLVSWSTLHDRSTDVIKDLYPGIARYLLPEDPVMEADHEDRGLSEGDFQIIKGRIENLVDRRFASASAWFGCLTTCYVESAPVMGLFGYKVLLTQLGLTQLGLMGLEPERISACLLLAATRSPYKLRCLLDYLKINSLDRGLDLLTQGEPASESETITYFDRNQTFLINLLIGGGSDFLNSLLERGVINIYLYRMVEHAKVLGRIRCLYDIARFVLDMIREVDSEVVKLFKKYVEDIAGEDCFDPVVRRKNEYMGNASIYNRCMMLGNLELTPIFVEELRRRGVISWAFYSEMVGGLRSKSPRDGLTGDFIDRLYYFSFEKKIEVFSLIAKYQPKFWSELFDGLKKHLSSEISAEIESRVGELAMAEIMRDTGNFVLAALSPRAKLGELPSEIRNEIFNYINPSSVRLSKTELDSLYEGVRLGVQEQSACKYLPSFFSLTVCEQARLAQDFSGKAKVEFVASDDQESSSVVSLMKRSLVS